MGIRIHQLPPLIANQIAAGEVIERPASVVKELLENSLDAGADTIAIEIGYGGLNQIKISDNGVGIVAEDLPLAIAAHATSKITTLNDLYAVESMGFRGEALASIASVAKVTISSKPAAQKSAMMIRAYGVDASISPCARTAGTTIDVVDLFYNTPVRKRFLKSEKLEFQAIETVIKRFALSAPSITLTLKHNGKPILSLPAATNEQTQLTRMARIMGSAFVKEAIFLDVERGGMRLYGWISNLNFQRSQNDRLWVYVNQRMVRDKLLHQAIKQTYDGLLHPGRFPACVLYLNIDLAEVDVNVHPTKHEVRFQQPRLVHDLFTSQLTAALGSCAEKKEEGYEAPERSSGAAALRRPSHEVYEPSISFDKGSRDDAEIKWVILSSCYILVFIKQQPYVVDLLALYQHSLQKYLSQLSLPLASRPLLVPMRYTITPQFKIYLSELRHHLAQLGMVLEGAGEHEVFIRTIPLELPYLDLHAFWDAVIQKKDVQPNELLKCMIQAQALDPRALSVTEKIELNQLLISLYEQEDKKMGIVKELTIEECRKLVDV